MDKISLSCFIVWATQTDSLDLLPQYVKLKIKHFELSMINRAFEKIHLKFNNYTKEDLFDLFFWLSIYLFFNIVAITLGAIYMLLDFIWTF